MISYERIDIYLVSNMHFFLNTTPEFYVELSVKPQ